MSDNESNWFIDDGIPGVGERPAWLPDKFKSVADLSKSYSELEKKLVSSVPESYDFSKSKYIDPEYDSFKDLQAYGKEKRVPKDFMDKMIDSFDKYMDEFNVDPEKEMQKLGPDAKDRLNILDNWAKANLTEASYNALTKNLTNAESIKALEELRGKVMSTNVQIPNQNSSSHETATLDEIKSELAIPANLEKYKTDKNYREDYRKRLEVAAKGNKEFVDKIGA